MDSWLYRLGKIFWRGSYERILPLEGPEILDADRMVELVRQVVTKQAESGQCVIVGRGAPYFLRNRGDTFSVFLYAPRSLKIERVAAQVGNRGQAEALVDSVDQDRAEFIRHYFGKEWPSRPLYHMMVNTVIGIDPTVDVLIRTIGELGPEDQTRVNLD